MIKTLSIFFGTFEQRSESDPAARKKAVAALLLEVAHADHQVTESEQTMLKQLLTRYWDADHAEAEALLKAAESEAIDQVSLHDHLQILKSHVSHQEREELVTQLWQIACADGDIHHWEEHLVRRLAELLGVGHQKFIEGKHQAQAEMSP
ncbi:MAG: tellurite resistance TerB family protein [bacterium]